MPSAYQVNASYFLNSSHQGAREAGYGYAGTRFKLISVPNSRLNVFHFISTACKKKRQHNVANFQLRPLVEIVKTIV